MMFRTLTFTARAAVVALAATFTLMASGLPAQANPLKPDAVAGATAPTISAPTITAPMATFGTPYRIEVPSPHFAEASPDGRKLFTVSASGAFASIDVATSTVTASIDVRDVTAMKVSPDGAKVYLATSEFQEHFLTVVDTAAITVVDIPVDGPVFSLAFTPDGSSVYAAVYGTPADTGSTPGSVAVIDVAAASVVSSIPVGREPTQILVTPDGAKVFALNLLDQSLSAIETSTNTVTSTIPLGGTSTGGSMSPDGSKLYYPKLEGGIAIAGVATDTVIGEVMTESVATAPSFTPDGSRAFVVDQSPNDNYVAEVDLQGNSLTRVSLGEGPVMNMGHLTVQVSPDGARLYVLGHDINVLSLPTLKPAGVILLEDGLLPRQLVMLPDGSMAYVVPGNQGDYVMAVSTADPENVWKDYNSDGTTDVLARDSAGGLWLYPGNGNSGWLPRSQVGSGWNIMNLLMASGDFDGDRKPDVLARDEAGDLWLYPGDGNSGWLPRSKVGVGWNAMTAVVAPGDFDDDGKADVLARDSSGDLWLYPGNGSGDWLPRSKVGTGWNVMTAIMGPGNLRNPGRDILARDTWGTLFLYEPDGSGGWFPPLLVGIEWNVMSAIVTPGDFDSDDVPDILARDASGTLWLYPGQGFGGYSPRVQVGVGWNVMTAII
ncbi:FG-GAP-like repeat-containing protein [Paenarthrobacter aromaticivorans]|uniref:FG-GAP-like repeat-containing protein n=1 Tax=Paenarthrobacter aromaticivorans TaxID=2849150 RepID=UPI003A806A43